MSMISSDPSLNYLPLDATESPNHKSGSRCLWLFLSKHIFTNSVQEIKTQLQIAHHMNRGAFIFKGNVLVLQKLHVDGQTERECVRQIVLWPPIKIRPKYSSYDCCITATHSPTFFDFMCKPLKNIVAVISKATYVKFFLQLFV